MLETLALVVLGCSIVVFFSQEFAGFFKKFFAMPGVIIFLPLALASLLVSAYESWVLEGLLYIQAMFYQVANSLAAFLPFTLGAPLISRALVLFAFSMVPVLVLNLWLRRRLFRPFNYYYLLSTVLWLFAVVLLTIS